MNKDNVMPCIHRSGIPTCPASCVLVLTCTVVKTVTFNTDSVIHLVSACNTQASTTKHPAQNGKLSSFASNLTSRTGITPLTGYHVLPSTCSHFSRLSTWCKPPTYPRQPASCFALLVCDAIPTFTKRASWSLSSFSAGPDAATSGHSQILSRTFIGSQQEEFRLMDDR